MRLVKFIRTHNDKPVFVNPALVTNVIEMQAIGDKRPRCQIEFDKENVVVVAGVLDDVAKQLQGSNTSAEGERS
jgi:hypothetical protein